MARNSTTSLMAPWKRNNMTSALRHYRTNKAGKKLGMDLINMISSFQWILIPPHRGRGCTSRMNELKPNGVILLSFKLRFNP